MTSNDDSARRPLLEDGDRNSSDDGSAAFAASPSRRKRWQKASKDFLATKTKHYVIMALVALDVAGILADIFVALISCDMDQEDAKWVADTREALHITGTVFSSLFLVELLVTIWAYGQGFFRDWFHCFDSFIIVASFVIDLLAHGVVEEIASLVIILRLWRFVKIVEELSVGASERMDDVMEKLEMLERENSGLKAQVQSLQDRDGQYGDGRLDR